MNFDIDHHVGAVQRSVSSVTRDEKAAKTVTLTRSYPTDIDDLWSALTNSERIQLWFLPITGDLNLGGRYQFEGNASGEIRECNSPTFLSVTWEWRDDVSWLEVRLSEAGENNTQLTLYPYCRGFRILDPIWLRRYWRRLGDRSYWAGSSFIKS